MLLKRNVSLYLTSFKNYFNINNALNMRYFITPRKNWKYLCDLIVNNLLNMIQKVQTIKEK